MPDPIVNDQINEGKKISSSGIFGGGEDVFNNEELFHPIEGENKKLEVDTDEELNEELNEEDINIDSDENELVVDDNETIGEKEFDPIFTEETDIEEPNLEVDKYKLENQKSEITDEKKTIQESVIDEPKIINDQSKIEKEPEEKKSDLMKKFGELVNKTMDLYKMAQMEDDQYIELVGGNTGKSQIMYNLRLIKEDEENNSILISKTETDTESGDQQQNNLQFKNNDGSLEILLDEQLLYDEIENLQEDQNRNMQVIDKLNKFIFLVSEELKIYERDRKEKEIMEQERRKLRDIFRNF